MKQMVIFAIVALQLAGCSHEELTKNMPHTLAISVGGNIVYGPAVIEFSDSGREIAPPNQFCPGSQESNVLKVNFYLNRMDGGLVRTYCSTSCSFGSGEALYKIETPGQSSTIECDDVASIIVSGLKS